MAETESYKGSNREEILQAVNNPFNKPVVFNGIPQNTFGMNTEKTEDEGTPVRAILFIIYFCAAMFVGVGFAQVDKLISFTAIGSIFLVIGLSAAIKGGLSNPIVLLVPYAGLLMTGIPIAMMIEKKHPGTLPFTFDSHSILRITIITMAVLGVLLVIFPVIGHFRMMSKCSQLINATCIYRTYVIKHGTKAGGKHTSYASYSPVWQYEINNVIYVTEELSYSNFESAGVGSVEQIRICPNEPHILFRPNRLKVIIPVCIGIMWTGLSLMALHFVK